MDKANIIKALELCGSGNGIRNCNECPYDGMECCDTQMCKDAIALLKANSEAPKPKYTIACIYTKKGNLLPYLNTDKVSCGMCGGNPSAYVKQRYAEAREIQLIAMFRFDGNKVFCKIKCPVNPIPVKGEFEAPSVKVIDQFLKANGWSFEQKFYPRMFE